MTDGDRAVRVFFPCTGLGRQRRGFETFTRECAAALRGDRRLELTVFGGGGPFAAADERPVFNLPRTGEAARAIGALTHRDPYFIEQGSFFAGFLPSLITGRPDVVYYADLNLGNACWHWRRISGQRFRLLFYNGGATTQPFTRCDLVQQVSPEHLADAIARGESPSRQVLLPHGLAVAPVFAPATDAERAQMRSVLGVPADRPVILSVGMLDVAVKRMDHVIREVASLQAPRPFLVMAGATSPETPAVISLARQLLGDTGFLARAFSAAEMPSLYRCADAFVLASLREGFGLVLLEALREGLPCIVHDTPTTEFLAGPHAMRVNARGAGAVAAAIPRALASRDEPAMAARHAWVRDRFSWDVLRARQAELLIACASGTRPAWAEPAA